VKLYTTHEYWLICPTHVLFTFDREACTQRRCIRCTLHARRPPQFWRYSGLLQECAAHVDRFIMPSRFARDRHVAEGLVGATSILPNFVPSAQPEAASGPRTDDPFFLYVGRLEKLKGVQDLIRLFTEYRGARLVIVGAGEYEAVLRKQALGMHQVEFLGFVHPAEIPKLYREAIAVLAPSLCYEVFPLSAAEALAQGTPVIGRRIGALAELLEESGGGLTFDTSLECRAAMERLQGDPGLRAELGARGRRTAIQKWTIEVHLTQYLDLVRGLIAKRAEGILRPQEPKKYAAVLS
jgi:glycosyltransferase involved in cell wall biosynthesis